jgi:hypothetical protein
MAARICVKSRILSLSRLDLDRGDLDLADRDPDDERALSRLRYGTPQRRVAVPLAAWRRLAGLARAQRAGWHGLADGRSVGPADAHPRIARIRAARGGLERLGDVARDVDE